MRRTVAPMLALAAGAVLAVGCSVSVGSDSLPEAEVERTTAEQLQEQVGAAETPEVDCPGDLDDEEGATMVCQLTPAGEDVTFDVTITGEGDGRFDIQVADEPS